MQDLTPMCQDRSLTDIDSLPAPEVIAEEIVEHLSAALAQFEAVASELRGDENGARTLETPEEEAIQELLPEDQ